jgi:nucleotide-binding universal stress UspA family protein
MKTLLFPTDFSENSFNALRYALRFARVSSSKVIIFNTYEVPHSHAGMLKSIRDIMKNDAEEGLNEVQLKIEQENLAEGIEYETMIREGNLVSQIKYVIEKNKINLIIMGTKGASGIEEVLIGSNTVDVVKNVKIPVLAIPENVNYKKIDKIVFAVDYKRIEDPARLDPLIELAKSADAEIQILNVSKDGTDTSGSGEAKKFSTYLGEVNHSYKTVKNSDIVEGITHFIYKNETDLLVMIIRKHNLFNALFHTSITRQLAFQTTVPLLVLHEK